MNAGRWLPAAAAVVLVAGGISVPVAFANASPDLPHRTAAQILALAAGGERVTGFDGSWEQVSNLGLPELPTDLTGGGTTASPTAENARGTAAADAGVQALGQVVALLSADQRGRVTVGEDGARVALYTDDGEQDVITNRGNIWVWNSDTNAVEHVKLPTLSDQQQRKLRAAMELTAPDTSRYTPQQVAQRFLDGLDEHTRVTVGNNRYVAGKATYTLVFTPRETDTLVRDVQVSVDNATGLPLRFVVYAKGDAEPAYRLGYTSLRYGVQDEDRFKFTAPEGAKVVERDYSVETLRQQPAKHPRGYEGHYGSPTVTPRNLPEIMLGAGGERRLTGVGVSGEGWSSVLSIPANDTTRELLENKQLRSLTTTLPGGSRLLSTKLFNIVVHGDGSIRAGSVPADKL